MARLRKGVSYRNVERPFTRKSKFRKLSYIKSVPASKVVKFETGNLSKKFDFKLELISKEAIQIRHNSLESARLTSNRLLEAKLGKTLYKLKIRVYPHHVLRENPIAAGAGADRMSTGMKMSFGKSIGLAARVRPGQTLIEVNCNKPGLALARKALERAKHKLPCGCLIRQVV